MKLDNTVQMTLQQTQQVSSPVSADSQRQIQELQAQLESVCNKQEAQAKAASEGRQQVHVLGAQLESLCIRQKAQSSSLKILFDIVGSDLATISQVNSESSRSETNDRFESNRKELHAQLYDMQSASEQRQRLEAVETQLLASPVSVDDLRVSVKDLQELTARLGADIGSCSAVMKQQAEN